ncbi:MAG: hypothetical protein MI741_00165, partial [Rhodospirillales bacterium]|nr:hypothetical protein [Rhodospirillales bacterium]
MMRNKLWLASLFSGMMLLAGCKSPPAEHGETSGAEAEQAAPVVNIDATSVTPPPRLRPTLTLPSDAEAISRAQMR